MALGNLAHVDGPPLTSMDDFVWIGDISRRAAMLYPDRDAIVFADQGVRITYAEIERRSNACVALFHARGLKAGDRVAYLGRNNDLFFPVLFGAIRAGIVVVPLNWRLAAPEIAYQLDDSQTRLLIVDADLKPVADQACIGIITPPQILTIEPAASGKGLRSLLDASADPAACPHDRDQVVLHLYTSGTTGRPKGVLISHGALSRARHAERISPDWADWQEGGVALSAMPNFHVGGMSWVLIGLVRCATVILTADPSPGNMLRLIKECGADRSFIVPSVLRSMVDDLRMRNEPGPKMTCIYYGAMVMSESLLRDAMATFSSSFAQFFGMTEVTGTATFLPPSEHDLARPARLKSVGLPIAGMSLEIRGPDRHVLKPLEHGEVWIKTETCMLGYWNLPEQTASAIIDGWYATGDGGYLDEDGFLYLTDRIKDMIVSGGENIYPVEVEEALRTHPAVIDAAVVGVRDARWGEVVVAMVELRPGHHVSEDELRTHARTRIASYKCPKLIQFGPLPRTTSGKVQRAQLRHRWAEERDSVKS